MLPHGLTFQSTRFPRSYTTGEEINACFASHTWSRTVIPG